MEDAPLSPLVALRQPRARVERQTLAGPLAARTLSTGDVASRFPKEARGRIAVLAFAHWLAFYGGFAAYVAGFVPGWAFATVGLFVFVRYFDLTHEEIHTQDDGSPIWGALRGVFSVSGPLQLGYAQLARDHRRHHAYEGTARDPDRWISAASPLVAVLHCLTQPEQAAVRYIRANGINRRTAFDLTLHFAAWTSLACVCSWPQFLLYNAVVRLGNGASWFVFTYLLHHRSIYGAFGPVRMPAWLRVGWLVLIGRNNLNAITYHFLHHAYGFVPARSLPALSAALTGEDSGTRFPEN
jgi:fatty acid desaturase